MKSFVPNRFKNTTKSTLNYNKIAYSKDEINSMIEIFSIESPSGEEHEMRIFISGILETIEDLDYCLEDGNILVTKGKLEEGEYYPCLVAHMDTVHSKSFAYKVISEINLPSGAVALRGAYKNVENKKWYYTGGCGDDGAGIWLILDILRKVPKMKAIFTHGEEVGCKGAGVLDLEFLSDCGYMIEGDRRGSGDIIHSSMCSDKFLGIVEVIGKIYHFKPATGLHTDVTILVERGAGISAINISVGYHNPHSNTEYTVVKELINSRNFVLAMLKELGYKRYIYKYENPIYKYSKYDYYNKYLDNDYSFYDDHYNHYYGDTKENIKEDTNINECSCSIEDHLYWLISLDCTKHNPIEEIHSRTHCGCGEELIQRKHTFYCSVCNIHKIIKTN